MGISNKVLVALAAVLGIGILAKREDVGAGLAGLGTGLSQIGTGLFDVGLAPFKSVGMGLGYAAGGITSFAEALGDVGRGIAALLDPILPWAVPTSNGARTEDRANGYPTIPSGAETWWAKAEDIVGLPSTRYGWRPDDRNGYLVWQI